MKTILIVLVFCFMACSNGSDTHSTDLTESDQKANALRRNFDRSFDMFLSHQNSHLFKTAWHNYYEAASAKHQPLTSKRVQEALELLFRNAREAVGTFHLAHRKAYETSFYDYPDSASLRLQLEEVPKTEQQRVEKVAAVANRFSALANAQLIDFSSGRACNLSEAVRANDTIVFYMALANFKIDQIIGACENLYGIALNSPEDSSDREEQVEEDLEYLTILLVEYIREDEARLFEYKEAFLAKGEDYGAYDTKIHDPQGVATRRLLARIFRETTGASRLLD